MPARLTRSAAVAVVLAVVMVGCSKSGDGSSKANNGPTQFQLNKPTEPVAVLPHESATSLSLAASKALFASAPVVVLAENGDTPAVVRAASAGVALGAPVLLTGDEDGLRTELRRLGAKRVLTFGDTAPTNTPGKDGSGDSPTDADESAESEVARVAAPEAEEALADLLDLESETPLSVGRGGEVSAIINLKRGSFTPLTLDEACEDPCPPTGAENNAKPDTTPTVGDSEEPDEPATSSADGDGDARGATDSAVGLPETRPAKPLSKLLTMASDSATGIAAVATATAAGTQLLMVPDGDPRSTSETVAAVAGADWAHVIGLGAAFGDAETLKWRLKTAETGVELPGGGQLVFPGKLYVALYGTPSTGSLGVLGKQDVPATVARARKLAESYDDLTDDTVVPALEVIATVAAGDAGSDGNYSNELSATSLRPLIDAAHEAGQYVMLDLQPGRSSFLDQAKRYSELLELPYVGLALDPEWNLGSDEVHLTQIGSTTAKEINEVVDWLADFTRKRSLPQKMLILHQFQVRMIKSVSDVDLSRSELAVLVHADGQGSQPAKQDTWRTLHAHGGNIQWWGWKNFYEKDKPMLTPEQTAQVVPFPNFISYQ